MFHVKQQNDCFTWNILYIPNYPLSFDPFSSFLPPYDSFLFRSFRLFNYLNYFNYHLLYLDIPASASLLSPLQALASTNRLPCMEKSFLLYSDGDIQHLLIWHILGAGLHIIVSRETLSLYLYVVVRIHKWHNLYFAHYKNRSFHQNITLIRIYKVENSLQR